MMNISIILLCFVFLFSSVKTVNKLENFGPYKVVYKRYELCKGPKQKNAADFSTNLTIRGNKTLRSFIYVFHENTSFDEIKIVVHSITANKKKLLYNYKVTDPCQHYFAAALIKAYFKTSNCIVTKGTYVILLSPEDTAKSYLGPKFFYGDYLFKTNILSKQGNIMCMIIEHEIVKKTE